MVKGNPSSDRDVSDLRPPAEPTDCPCSCHKPKHEARKPHPNTMIGRGSSE